MTRAIILVGIGGGLGSILRYITTLIANKYFPGAFPAGTFAVNIIGCLLLGMLLGLFLIKEQSSTDLKYFLVTGFCGGYTTFSAFASENINLFQSGNSFTALLYIAASVILSLLAVWGGLSLIKLF